MKNFLLVLFLCIPTLLFAQKKYPDIDIPYKKYVLDNGLNLIVHEDHKAPIASFNIWYHVGSKNEKKGKTGFAHLFEHLMFNGSEHYNDDYFQLMESIGATDLNGTTNYDRTNYFENIPVNAIDKVLWIESDRMGFMLKAIDTLRLNEQRGVVQNEKRQGENQPYAIAWDLIPKNTYPANHPYSWTVIGEMEDLNAASMTDVQEWFKKYYGPNNASIVIAGDVNGDEIFEKVKKYFGDILASPPISKHSQWIAKMEGKRHQVAEDRVPQARLHKVWNVPGWGTKDITYLGLLGSILTSGKTSRIYKRLVYDEQLASNVYFYADENEIGGQFTIMADAKPGVTLAQIDRVINEELQKVFTQGVTVTELERAKTRYFSNFVKGMERIGGFGGKSDILAQSITYGGSPDSYKKLVEWLKNATVADIKKVANDWLTDGEYTLEVLPYGTFTNATATLDRSKKPDSGTDPEVKFPEVKKFTLNNGLKVAFVQRNAVPVINMSLMINAGYSADPKETAGIASFTGRMLSEGTKTRSSLQISDEQADLGADLYSYADVDHSFVSMNALKNNFDASLKLFSDVLLNPSFPQKDFDRVQKERLLDIKQEQVQPFSMGLRILPRLVYGSGHAYSNPLTGSGTEESVKKFTRDDLARFHQTWFAPNNSTLIVVGNIEESELKTKLETSFASWKKKDIPVKNISEVALPSKASVYIIDKPGSVQSIIFGAEVSPSAKDPQYESIKMSTRILGGDFTSRINMNLREDKHWSYGAGLFNLDAVGQGFLLGYAPVQTDKTKESLAEMQKEIIQFVGKKPVTETEFKKVKDNAVLELPGVWETNSSVLWSLQKAIKYDRDESYLMNYPAMLRNLSLDDITKASAKIIKPTNLTWVIVGDRSKIEKGIKELELGEIKYIDTEGIEGK